MCNNFMQKKLMDLLNVIIDYVISKILLKITPILIIIFLLNIDWVVGIDVHRRNA